MKMLIHYCQTKALGLNVKHSTYSGSCSPLLIVFEALLTLRSNFLNFSVFVLFPGNLYNLYIAWITVSCAHECYSANTYDNYHTYYPRIDPYTSGGTASRHLSTKCQDLLYTSLYICLLIPIIISILRKKRRPYRNKCLQVCKCHLK